MKEIYEEQIKKTLNQSQQLIDVLIKNPTKSTRRICVELNIPKTLPLILSKLKYIENTASHRKPNWKVNVEILQPFHSRKIIEIEKQNTSKYNKNYAKKHQKHDLTKEEEKFKKNMELCGTFNQMSQLVFEVEEKNKKQKIEIQELFNKLVFKERENRSLLEQIEALKNEISMLKKEPKKVNIPKQKEKVKKEQRSTSYFWGMIKKTY